MRSLVLIAHNLRSAHNVGSLLRTAEGLGAEQVFLTGYTPYPAQLEDQRLAHQILKIDRQISKTALGAEKLLGVHVEIDSALTDLKQSGFVIAAIEQSEDSVELPKYNPPNKLALIVGREVDGLEPEILKHCQTILEIPMFGKKESFNVVQAAAMSLYHCRFAN